MNDELISRMLNNYRRVVETLDTIFESPERCSIYNDRPNTKMTGFTQVKGRRRLSKKQRKQLKSKKQ
jgi:hypothetical protein